jgi:hypothetical protein
MYIYIILYYTILYYIILHYVTIYHIIILYYIYTGYCGVHQGTRVVTHGHVLLISKDVTLLAAGSGQDMTFCSSG